MTELGLRILHLLAFALVLWGYAFVCYRLFLQGKRGTTAWIKLNDDKHLGWDWPLRAYVGPILGIGLFAWVVTDFLEETAFIEVVRLNAPDPLANYVYLYIYIALLGPMVLGRTLGVLDFRKSGNSQVPTKS